MSHFFRRTLVLSLCAALITACSTLPRGAPVQREILRADENAPKEFAVYGVTRTFLPTVARWPATGVIRSSGWLKHSHSSAGPVLAPGDRLNLMIWDSDPNSLLTSPEQKSVSMEGVQISPAGTIFLPYVNAVHVAGTGPEQARRKIQRKMEEIIPSAQVQLYLQEGKQNMADLVGGVSSPGSYAITDSHFTVLNLISQGGGVNPALRHPRVRLNRNGKSYVKSVSAIFENPGLDTILRGGDKVIVEQDDRYFLSLGAAGQESLVYFEKERLSALDAMSLVGGVSDSRGNPAGILILRQYPAGAVDDGRRGPEHARTVFTLDLTSADGLFSAGQFAINPKDTVLVTESPITATQTIFRLIGSVFGLANTASNAVSN
ncbi:MAG: polysaccharide export protein [Gammaproteobacteria bacterium]|nr:polysaccharide export protein [Gammaproteobacteria bacterium]